MIDTNISIIKKIVKLTLFIGIVFSLLFCITWQSVHLYLMNLRIEKLAQKKKALEKTVYLKNMELSSLKSRDRIEGIAVEEFGMTPITYYDVKLIVY